MQSRDTKSSRPRLRRDLRPSRPTRDSKKRVSRHVSRPKPSLETTSLLSLIQNSKA